MSTTSTTVTTGTTSSAILSGVNTAEVNIVQYAPLAIQAVQTVEAALKNAPSQTKLNTALAIISAGAAVSQNIPIPSVQAIGGLVGLIAGLVQAFFPSKTGSASTVSPVAAIPVVGAVQSAPIAVTSQPASVAVPAAAPAAAPAAVPASTPKPPSLLHELLHPNQTAAQWQALQAEQAAAASTSVATPVAAPMPATA